MAHNCRECQILIGLWGLGRLKMTTLLLVWDDYEVGEVMSAHLYYLETRFATARTAFADAKFNNTTTNGQLALEVKCVLIRNNMPGKPTHTKQRKEYRYKYFEAFVSYLGFSAASMNLLLQMLHIRAHVCAYVTCTYPGYESCIILCVLWKSN